MTKADLVERVTAQISRTAGPMISKKDCARVVDSFLDAIKKALQEQKNIAVRGFGTFTGSANPSTVRSTYVPGTSLGPVGVSLPQAVATMIDVHAAIASSTRPTRQPDELRA